MSTSGVVGVDGQSDSDSGSHYSESSDEPHLEAEDGDVEEDNASDVDTEDEGSSEHAEGADGDNRILRDPRIWKLGPSFDRKVLKARSKVVRVRGKLRPQYRTLHNAVIESILDPTLDQTSTPLNGSDLGISSWTSEEKSLFFSRLPLWGQGNTKRLAECVGSKSEAEVRDYLQLLQRGSIEDYLQSQRHFGIALDEIPAALEVPTSCEAHLDLAAEALGFKAEKADIKREKARHGSDWLLDVQLAARIEQQLDVETRLDAAGDDVKDVRPQQLSVPAAELLHLGNWLELAKLFMTSSADHEFSWVDLIEGNDERPSLYHTAFSDFHNLAVSLTKRIAYASHFQAMSRIRATDRNDPEHVVRHQDVQAACKMLELNNDWHEFWVGLPRRTRLEIFTRGKEAGDGNKNSRGRILTYNQVESYLRSSAKDEADIVLENESEDAEISSPNDVEEDDNSSTSYDSDFWTDASESERDETRRPLEATTAAEGSEEDSDSKPEEDSDASSEDGKQYDRDKAETAYLEALDQHASRMEERRLWEILRIKPGTDEPKDEEADLPLPPPRKRKRVEDIVDWRDKVEWRPEWEEFQILPGPERFVAMGKRGADAKKRRLEKYGLRDQP
ncbi:hypothetical protein KVT40_006559 [Elsinoe batatas]|uniref:Myb-like domain-containing protein n=1 Tax=Elsinoe batatas TaxID=2601811 RepID=A0A8K0PGA0_9PEZI|nr:hypothetical protein KVT40_006559 [Elsinoe batatas]